MHGDTFKNNGHRIAPFITCNLAHEAQTVNTAIGDAAALGRTVAMLVRGAVETRRQHWTMYYVWQLEEWSFMKNPRNKDKQHFSPTDAAAEGSNTGTTRKAMKEGSCSR